MPSELGGGLSYSYPTEAVHFYVVGLGDAIEVPAWNLEHKWDDSTLSLTVSAYGADTPAQVVIRNENGDIVDPSTGRAVLPGEDGEPVSDAPYRVAVTKDAKTDLAVLPRGTYYVTMVEAPTMGFDYTVMEAEVKDGVPTGDEIEVAKKGTWPFPPRPSRSRPMATAPRSISPWSAPWPTPPPSPTVNRWYASISPLLVPQRALCSSTAS